MTKIKEPSLKIKKIHHDILPFVDPSNPKYIYYQSRKLQFYFQEAVKMDRTDIMWLFHLEDKTLAEYSMDYDSMKDACRVSSRDTIEFLFDLCDVREKIENGWNWSGHLWVTAAISFNRIDILKLLYSINPDLCEEKGKEKRGIYGYRVPVIYGKRKGAKDTFLGHAAANATAETFEFLLEKFDLDIHEEYYNYQNCFSVAVKNNRINILNVLYKLDDIFVKIL